MKREAVHTWMANVFRSTERDWATYNGGRWAPRERQEREEEESEGETESSRRGGEKRGRARRVVEIPTKRN